MNTDLLPYRARVRGHKDGSFSVVAYDVTGNKVVVKQGIAPFNRKTAINEQRMYNLRVLNELKRKGITPK